MLRASLIPTLLVSYALVAQAPEAPRSQSLSLQDAIRVSLENNLQVQIARETRNATQAGVLYAEGSFDWTLNSTFAWSHVKDLYDGPSYGGVPVVDGKTLTNARSLTVGTVKPFEWGGTFKASYDPSYKSSSLSNAGGPYANTSPAPYTGSFSASYTQSLLRNFGRDTAASELIVARKSAEAANYSFEKSIIDLVATTEGYYWDVVYAQRYLESKRQSLELANKQLKENRIRVEVGTLAPIEVTSAEATAAQREQEIIAAEAQLLNAKDTLIRALYPKAGRPSDLTLTDAPNLGHIALEPAAAEKMALERRVEIRTARLDLESRQVREQAAHNRLLPQLDVSVGYTGGAANHPALGSVNGDLTSNRYPGYNASLTLSMPIANSAARGTYAQAKANLRQSELGMQDLQLSITLEVRQAFRNVEAAEKGVKAAEVTRIFREKDLDAEQKKFENGMSTNFVVLGKQDALDSARSAELQAQIAYAKAVTALEKALGNLMEARKLKFQ